MQSAPSGRVRRAPQSAAGCGEPGTNLGHEVLAVALSLQLLADGRRDGAGHVLATAEVAQIVVAQERDDPRRKGERRPRVADQVELHLVVAGKVAVLRDEEGLSVSIEDNGIGFDPNQEKGIGLLGMEERVTRLGGLVRLESDPGRGTVLSIRLPFKNVAEEARA